MFLAWREALEKAGIELSVWRIHRRIGMSGGLFVNALLRETGHQLTKQEAVQLQRLHAEAHARLVTAGSPTARGTRTPRLSVWGGSPLGGRYQRAYGKRWACIENSWCGS